ncbi:hypothetical protein PoB_004435800 [Plakobranchus ocellatus]|uniref:Uncharacterized protein n=1 Tax=Plakobranchus ocellatus TaxID=259542 RepID=A0AAV4BFB0_9GAST|nr:hypothetical protein PoB_004435800 [Plakobranchus ocellatus]
MNPAHIHNTNGGFNKATGKILILFIINPQQGDLRLLDSPSDQGAGGGARTRDGRVPAHLRANSLATVPPTPQATDGETRWLPVLGYRSTVWNVSEKKLKERMMEARMTMHVNAARASDDPIKLY